MRTCCRRAWRSKQAGKPGEQCPGTVRQEQGQRQGRNGRIEEVTRLRNTIAREREAPKGA